MGNRLKEDGPTATPLAAQGQWLWPWTLQLPQRESPLCSCYFLRPVGASRTAEGQQLPLVVALAVPAWELVVPVVNKLTYTSTLCVLCTYSQNLPNSPILDIYLGKSHSQQDGTVIQQ